MKDPIIFHIDVNNAFLSWTAVKLLNEGYKEDIRNIPSIIGGDENTRHGIVLAKSPIAKKYKVQTAETIYQAKKKCPNLQIFPPDYKWYSKESRELFSYLSKYSPSIEQFSIDECFIDMTGTNYLYKDYLELAHFIKDDIKKKFKFTVNIGIGNNKLCAKMASDFEKPDKVHTLFKDEVVSKMWPLDVGDLLFVGKRTKEVLNSLKIYTIGDLAKADEKVLNKHFKSQGKYLKNAAYGIDDSKVEPRSSKNKSISTSMTLPTDTNDIEKLKDIIFYQCDEVCRDLRKQKQFAKTVAVFYKSSDFENMSMQAKLDNPSNRTKDIYALALQILNKNYHEEMIRLIGVRVADLTDKSDYQISLFEEVSVKKDDIEKTVDEINNKFGKSVIIPASFKKNSKITPKK